MYNNKIIGIGIITYNRQFNYSQLLEKIKQNSDIDFIVTVKNKDIDYQNNDPKIICNDNIRTFNFHIKENLGIGYYKNIALKKLMALNCDHYFLIEDDVRIKNDNVFKEYIDTAIEFNLEHLNFCKAYDIKLPSGYQNPFMYIQGKTKKLNLYRKLNGCFSYFTINSLKKVGLFDEKYINLIEHCEHTYRMSLLGFHTPFYSFADIDNSNDFIEDLGIQTSISHSEEYQKNALNAIKYFQKTYGKKLTDIHVPNKEEILNFLNNKIIL